VRILVLGINYWPEQTGIAPFTTGRCEYLAACGHEVIVCTTLPYYPEWRIAPVYKRRFLVHEERNGVTILRSRIYVPQRVNSPRRVLHESSFVAASILRALVQRRPDAMLVVSPPLGLALSAVILSRRWGIPYVFHVPDLQPDAAVDLGMLAMGPFVRGLYALERLAYRNAALISTLTEPMRQRIISKGIPADKVKLFSDWAAPEFFRIALEDQGAGFRRVQGLDDSFLVLHSGNMGLKQGLEVVLDAAELSRGDAGIDYLLVGDGAAHAFLEKRAAARALSNVHFMPLQPRAEFMGLLAATDVSLITQQRVVANTVFPSKTLTLMAAGRPVIASVNTESEVARVVRNARAGLVVEPENPSALFDAVKKLRNDAHERHAMSIRAREYAQAHWDRNRILAQTTAQLEALALSCPNPRNIRSERLGLASPIPPLTREEESLP
jgi:colanic acid biosynthesis glycosyl transferase WcaI